MHTYSANKRLMWCIIALVIGVVVAGFWNYKLVDGIGKEWFASPIVGESESISYEAKGMAFGFIFAVAAGLAASFTACNCVVFAMLPSLVCHTDRKSARKTALRALSYFTGGVLAVCAVYGAFVVSLGLEEALAYNERGIRISQAQITFSIIGVVLIVWGILSFSRMNGGGNQSGSRFFAALSSPQVKAGIMGLLAGFFTVGRPYPVFREFLLFAAESGNIIYGSLVMMLQGIGQIAFMVLLFMLIIWLFGTKLASWAERKPQQIQLISHFAMVAGGAFFLYYWGFSFWFDIGRWGFKLGWYS